MAVDRPGPERITAARPSALHRRQRLRRGRGGPEGPLAPGLLADFAVLSQDPTAVPPEQIGETSVLETVVGGRTVYRRRRSSS
jgi:predicted amidohydrolase YtcJ